MGTLVKKSVSDESGPLEPVEVIIFPKSDFQPLAVSKLEGILGHSDHLIFNKPDLEVYNPSLMYEITLENETRVLYVIKRKPSRFQPRCDIVLLADDGETILRIINPKRMVHKLNVLIGDTVIGSVIKTKLNMCGPTFRLRDANKSEIAVVESSLDYCCMTCQKLCCNTNYGVFQVIRKVKHEQTTPGNKDSAEDQPIGIIHRDITFNDRAGHRGIIEIKFENNPVVDVHIKCLLIAAAICIDFSVFAPQDGQPDVKVIITVGLVLLVLLVCVGMGVVYVL